MQNHNQTFVFCVCVWCVCAEQHVAFFGSFLCIRVWGRNRGEFVKRAPFDDIGRCSYRHFCCTVCGGNFGLFNLRKSILLWEVLFRVSYRSRCRFDGRTLYTQFEQSVRCGHSPDRLVANVHIGRDSGFVQWDRHFGESVKFG